MKVIGFKPEEIQTVYKILAAILHLVSRDSQSVSSLCKNRALFQILFPAESNSLCENFTCGFENCILIFFYYFIL